MGRYSIFQNSSTEIDDSGAAGDVWQIPIGGEGQRWDVAVLNVTSECYLMRRNLLGDGTMTDWYRVQAIPQKVTSGQNTITVITGRTDQYGISFDTANEGVQVNCDPAGNLNGDENFAQWLAGVGQMAKEWGVGKQFTAGDFVLHNSGLFEARTTHEATALGDEPGVVGTEGEWIAYWKPLTLRETVYGPCYVTPTGQLVYPSCSVGSITTPMTSTQWTATTVSTTGAPAINNTIEDGFRMTLTTTGATAALIREYAAMSFNRNWLPGKNSEINWTKPFRIRIPLRCEIGGTGSGFKYTLFFGGLSAAPTVHTMSGKGLNLCIIGTGAGAGTVQIGAHNGTTQVNSGASAQTFNGTMRHLDLWYIPGTGAALMLNGEVLGTIAPESLPTGVSASANGWAALMEHTTATNGTGIIQQHPFIIDFLSE